MRGPNVPRLDLRGSVARPRGGAVPDCGLQVFDAQGVLVREARVSVPDRLDQPTLDQLHRQCISGLPALYARLSSGARTRALFLHAHVVPEQAVVTASRRRSPGRWLTAAVSLGPGAGGRAVFGPEVLFRQVDVDPERAWLIPMLLNMVHRPASRQLRIGGSGSCTELWTWEVHGERFYYREQGTRWWLYGAGNTPLLRLEQAVHLADPQSVEDYLWAVGAIVLGSESRRRKQRRSRRP